MLAGSRTPRTTVASMRTATASPTPTCFIDTCESVAKVLNTATMITAALVTTPAVEVMPRRMASGVPVPASTSSRIRLRMKTW